MKCLSAGHTKSASAPESTTMDHCWFDHVQRKKFLTNHVASLAARPQAKDPTGNKTSLNIAVRVDTFSEFALMFTGTGRPDAAVSDADESGGDVETTCAETASGHDLAPWWIRDNSALFCIDISRCSLSCLCTLCRLCHWISYLIICVRICTCLHEHKCLWRGVCRESSRCAHPCGRLLHPFASQAEWSFPGSFGASRSVISVSDSTLDRLQGMHHCLFGWFLQPATPCSVFDTVSASTTSS